MVVSLAGHLVALPADRVAETLSSCMNTRSSYLLGDEVVRVYDVRMEVDSNGQATSVYSATASVDVTFDAPVYQRRPVISPARVIAPVVRRSSLAYVRPSRVLDPIGTPSVGEAFSVVAAAEEPIESVPAPRTNLTHPEQFQARLADLLDSDFSDDEGPTEPPYSAIRSSSVWTRFMS
jgi:hypothetical protein